uniref:SMP domain-containing protein n=1 Tax=Aegilops tauschii subsp. strangulata TaxID=200361 RepID=A0A453LT39_AEGTS
RPRERQLNIEARAMAQAKCGVDSQTYAQIDTCSPGRVFDAAVTVAPSDDERLAHGGCRAVVDEEQDTKVKISEALEAAARAVGYDPVERSDAAAIRAAEARAVGTGVDIPAGIAAQAQAAADANATAAHAEDKITIGDVLKVRAVLR